MEGIADEAASLAGHLKLDNLCWIYDNNHITIEGHTEPRLQRGRGHALHRLRLERHAGGRRQRPRHARPRLRRPRKKTTDRPTLIIVDSHIGYGAPTKQDTHAAHGEPLGEEEIKPRQALLRLAGGREVPGARRRARALRGGHRRARGEAARRVDGALRGLQGGAPEGGRRALPHAAPAAARGLGQGRCPSFPADAKGLAGRDASAKVLNAVAPERALAHRAAPRTWRPPPRRASPSRARATSRRAATAAATSTSASASTPWARS